MSILNEICMTIDMINSEDIKRNRNIISKYYHNIKNQMKMRSIINRYTDFEYVTVDTIVDFMRIYDQTKNVISFSSVFDVYIKEENGVMYADYHQYEGQSLKLLYHIIPNNNKLELTYLDEKRRIRYPVKFSVVDDLRYTGIDETRTKILDYTNFAYKLLIKKYLFARVELGGSDNGKQKRRKHKRRKK